MVFDALDGAVDAVRRRFPGPFLVVGLLTWLAATAVLVFVVGSQSSALAAWYGLSPAVLLAVVARWGIGRLVWPTWPLGVAPAVLVPMVLATDTGGTTLETSLSALLAFAYCQVLLGTAATVDYLRLRRADRPDPPGARWTARRRILQAKVLVATLVVLGMAQNSAISPVLFRVLMSFATVPILIAVWRRSRPLAWFAAITVPVVYLLSLWQVAPADRWAQVVELGWPVLVATWLWARAAVARYWPRSYRPPASPDPAEPPPDVPWRPAPPPTPGGPGR